MVVPHPPAGASRRAWISAAGAARLCAVGVLCVLPAGPVHAQPQPSGPAAPAATASPTAADERPLYAVEVTIGPRWDASLRPQDQPLFREHSAHLRRLRDAGHLVIGARYADKGLLVLAADTEAAARALLDADPSIQAGIFRYQIHPYSVFYGGTVRAAPRPPPAPPAASQPPR
ncbi:MAG: hypothetical protein JNN18_15060 [Rubrivivax sp.]|nr:hypothetical protein [Rubrivivax sp.]